MNKYKDWKMIDWIIAGILAFSSVTLPNWIIDQHLYKLPIMATGYDYPYNIPIIVAGIFLIYCFLSLIYWIINKNINMVIHYCLIAIIYITIPMLYVIAHNSGV